MSQASQPLFLLLASSLLFSFFLITSYGNNIDSCPSHMCGSVSIRYPFWIVDASHTATSTHDLYCGYRGLRLNCSSDRPILKLPNDASYYVTDINYGRNTLTLVDVDVTTNLKCPRRLQNFTLDTTVPLFDSQSNLNISFYFNCDDYHHIVDPPLNSIECFEFGVNKSYVFVAGEEPDDFQSDWYQHCEEKVVTKVLHRENINMDLMRRLEDGFKLHWRNMTECGACEESDGLCGGYQNGKNESLCFCPDGPTIKQHCKKDDKVNLRRKLIIGFAATGIGMSLMGFIFFLRHRRNKKRHSCSSLISRNNSSYNSSMMDIEKTGTYLGLQMFSYSELEEATKKFDSEKILGDGGFGIVYKGKLKDGRIVAVKRLYEKSYKRVEQFINEIEILTRLRHQNLVSLYGCTSRHCRELILVYEYIPNGTVADHLHGEQATPGSLTWTIRMSIAIETATALAYLHASDVIHRDVKTNNILLDNNFCVKVADFGLSRLYPTDVTHVSTAPQGTPGYVDPEYHDCYHLTDKSDVYSFGVVLFELISSMPAVDITRKRHEINLSHMAMTKIQSNALHELVDPSLGFETDYKVKKMVTDVAELAFQCLQNEREMRPSMEEVLEALIGIQRRDYDIQKTSVDIPTDDAVLLKNNPATLSPDSVTAKWLSTSATSDFSG